MGTMWSYGAARGLWSCFDTRLTVLEGRFIWYLLAALLVSGAVGASLAYWVAKACVASQHAADPLQAQGGREPGQEVGPK
jgi:hypothetical protein